MDIMTVLSFIAILAGLVFVCIRAFQGHLPFFNCLIATTLICICSNISIVQGISQAFASGTANMLKTMLLFFCACTMFGKAMQESKYADSIAYFVSTHVNVRWAPTIIFLITVILAMGGMLIATCIIVYPIAIILLEKADYSKRIMPAANLSGFWTITCCSPLIPSAANNILQNLLKTGPQAGLVPGLASTLVLMLAIIIYLQWQASHWKKKGIHFEGQDEGAPVSLDETREYSPFWKAVLPIICVLLLYNLLNVSIAVSMFAATLLIALLEFRQFGLEKWVEILEKGLMEGVVPALNLSVMGGLGAVIALTPFYKRILLWMSHTDINPYVLCLAGGTVMAGIVGSSTSGLATLVPNILPLIEKYVSQGYDLGNMHRLLCIGSISLDSLPHNGSLMACCGLMRRTLKESYFPIFITCTLFPLLVGVCVTLPLSMLGFH